jgi:hypothetical protein
MRNRWQFRAVLTVLVGLALSARAAEVERERPLVPFGPGESCTFAVGYGLIDAGEAILTVEGVFDYYGSTVYHLRTRARSNRFFSAIFKVRDQADSYMDVHDLHSRYFNKHLREGQFRRDVEIHFDHEQGKAYFPNGRENEVPAGVQDVLSAFFRVRAMELIDGAELALPTHGDGELYDLKVIVHGREMLETILGNRRCIKLQPMMVDEGLFQHKGDLFVWLTDDERRVPVRVQANIAVGAIEARLSAYSPPDPRAADGR